MGVSPQRVANGDTCRRKSNMDRALEQFFDNQWTVVLLGMIAAVLVVLGKAADKLVEEAVVLAERSGLPKVIIGATIVSLGTTSPEAAVSVLAALKGEADLASGQRRGFDHLRRGADPGHRDPDQPAASGPADREPAGVDPVRLRRAAGGDESWPWGVGPWQLAGNPLEVGGNLPQAIGVAFVVLLGVYLWMSVRWAKESTATDESVAAIEARTEDIRSPLPLVPREAAAGRGGGGGDEPRADPARSRSRRCGSGCRRGSWRRRSWRSARRCPSW